MAARARSDSNNKTMLKARSDVSFLAKHAVEMQVDHEKYHSAKSMGEKNKIEAHMKQTYQEMGRLLKDLKGHHKGLPRKVQQDIDELEDVYKKFDDDNCAPGLLEVFSFNLGRLSGHLGS